jgi:biopolymer transport protein ExbB
MSPDARLFHWWRAGFFCCFLLILGAVTERRVLAEPDDPPADNPAGGAEASLTDTARSHAATEELERAVRDAKKRLDAVQAQAEKEAQDLEARISQETKAVTTLRETEKKSSDRLRSLKTEADDVEAKASAAAQAKQARNRDAEAARTELSTQVSRLKERLLGGLTTAQDEQLLQAAGDIRSSPNQALLDQVEVFFELCERVLGYARTAALIQIPVRLADGGDRIQSLKVLRLGLIAGYFSRSGGEEAGFVFADPTAKSGFVAESRGLESAQQAAIHSILLKPDKGALLPMDVTGGAAIAKARTADTLLSWFRRGGGWMWPILGIGALGLLVALERALTLGLRFLSVRKCGKHVTALLRSGRLSGGGAQNFNGNPGKVFQAAINSRDQGSPAIQSAVEEALLHHEQGLQARLGWVSLAGGAAALLGFIGTVSLLIQNLRLVGLEGYGSPAALSAGVAEALVPTQAGLCVALLCLVLRGLLSSIADSLTTRVEASVLSLLSSLHRAEDAVVPHPHAGARL